MPWFYFSTLRDCLRKLDGVAFSTNLIRNENNLATRASEKFLVFNWSSNWLVICSFVQSGHFYHSNWVIVALSTITSPTELVFTYQLWYDSTLEPTQPVVNRATELLLSRCQTNSLSKDLQNIRDIKNFKPLHPNISVHIPHTVLYTFPKCASKENLFNNQKVLQLFIISFILVNLMFDSGMILKGEIRC